MFAYSPEAAPTCLQGDGSTFYCKSLTPPFYRDWQELGRVGGEGGNGRGEQSQTELEVLSHYFGTAFHNVVRDYTQVMAQGGIIRGHEAKVNLEITHGAFSSTVNPILRAPSPKLQTMISKYYRDMPCMFQPELVEAARWAHQQFLATVLESPLIQVPGRTAYLSEWQIHAPAVHLKDLALILTDLIPNEIAILGYSDLASLTGSVNNLLMSPGSIFNRQNQDRNIRSPLEHFLFTQLTEPAKDIEGLRGFVGVLQKAHAEVGYFLGGKLPPQEGEPLFSLDNPRHPKVLFHPPWFIPDLIVLDANGCDEVGLTCWEKINNHLEQQNEYQGPYAQCRPNLLSPFRASMFRNIIECLEHGGTFQLIEFKTSLYTGNRLTRYMDQVGQYLLVFGQMLIGYRRQTGNPNFGMMDLREDPVFQAFRGAQLISADLGYNQKTGTCDPKLRIHQLYGPHYPGKSVRFTSLRHVHERQMATLSQIDQVLKAQPASKAVPVMPGFDKQQLPL